MRKFTPHLDALEGKCLLSTATPWAYTFVQNPYVVLHATPPPVAVAPAPAPTQVRELDAPPAQVEPTQIAIAVGPAGPAGAPGAPGPAGDVGPQGPQGPAGASADPSVVDSLRAQVASLQSQLEALSTQMVAQTQLTQKTALALMNVVAFNIDHGFHTTPAVDWLYNQGYWS